ncbi:MAG TPA: VWA domain-containing protein, partial [Pyrinomonadaceae bacterium]|nr:VWA domain-containing protein [Pyrinomonadaceae bacterium]
MRQPDLDVFRNFGGVLQRRGRSAIWLFLALPLLALPARAQEPQVVDTIKIDTNLISVPVIVSDRDNRYVPDLKVDAFRLFDNQVEQKISYFDTGEEPLNVVLMLDTSLSTSGMLDDIKKAAKEFIKELRPKDRAMIVTFDWQFHKLSELTDNRKQLEGAIKEAKVARYAGTVLNDALLDITSTVLQPVRGRKAIVILSDGNDRGSTATVDSLLKAESEADAMIYSIYYQPEFMRFLNPPDDAQGRDRGPGPFHRPGQPRGPRRPFGMDGEQLMEQLADVTGGRFYQGETKKLKETFALIAEELRHQYRLGFYPGTLERDGTTHALAVKVNMPNVSVR